MEINSLAAPGWLLLSLAAWPLVLRYRQMRRHSHILLSLAPLGSITNSRFVSMLASLSDCLLVLVVIVSSLTLAKPIRSESKMIIVKKSPYDVVLVGDFSSSMGSSVTQEDGTTKVKLLYQKELFVKLIGYFKRQNTGDRLGFIAFGDKPFILWPLSFDYGSLSERIIDDESKNFLPVQYSGTNIAAAVQAAIDHLDREGKSQTQMIVLVTDGLNPIERVLQEKIAAQWQSPQKYSDSVLKKKKRLFLLAGIKLEPDASIITLCHLLDGECFTDISQLSPETVYEKLRKYPRGEVKIARRQQLIDYGLVTYCARLVWLFSCLWLVLALPQLNFLSAGTE
jgi:hypothetical protein